MSKQHHESSWTNGLDDGLGQAIELVIAPLLFGFVGFGLDRWFGTGQFFMLVLGIFGVVGAFTVAYFRYEAKMNAEAERIAAERAAAGKARSWTRT